MRLEWPLDEAQGYQGPLQKIVVELKLVRTALETVIADGLKQTAECADKCGADEAYLVVFDRRPDRSWDECIWQRTGSHAGRTINVWGM